MTEKMPSNMATTGARSHLFLQMTFHSTILGTPRVALCANLVTLSPDPRLTAAPPRLSDARVAPTPFSL